MSYSMEGRTGKEFLTARFWRLIPIFIICVTITTMIEWSLPNVRNDRTQNVISYIINMFCLPSGMLACDALNIPFKGRAVRFSWVDGAYWSLLVEIRYYLLLWLLYYVMKIRQPVWIIAALGLLAPLNLETVLISKSKDFFIYLCFFAFGMAYSGCLRKVACAKLSLIFSFLVFSIISLLGTAGISMSLSATNYVSFVYCFLIFLVVMSIFKNRRNTWISYLGVLSYPLYLLHQDIGLISIKLLEYYFSHSVAAAITFGMITLLAIRLQKLLERRQPRFRFHVEQFLGIKS